MSHFFKLYHSSSSRWIVFLSCTLLVGYGIFRASPPPMLFNHFDKVEHVAAFLALALSARLAMPKLAAIYFWPVLFGLAPLLEYLQGEWQPTREYSLGDSYANAAGVALAFTFFGLVSVLRRSN